MCARDVASATTELNYTNTKERIEGKGKGDTNFKFRVILEYNKNNFWGCFANFSVFLALLLNLKHFKFLFSFHPFSHTPSPPSLELMITIDLTL